MNIIIQTGKFSNDIPEIFSNVKCKQTTHVYCKWHTKAQKKNTIQCQSYIPHKIYKDKNGFILKCILELTNEKQSSPFLKSIFGNTYKKYTKTCVYELYPNTIIIK